jgi:hypothetical protein
MALKNALSRADAHGSAHALADVWQEAHFAQRLAQQLLICAEETARRVVDQIDHAALIRGDDRIGCGVQDCL